MLENGEPQRLAEQLLHDVVAGVGGDGPTVYDLLVDRADQIAVGRHLVVPLTQALKAYVAGDRSPSVLRLVQLAGQVETLRVEESERARHAQVLALHEKAMRLTGHPELAAQMTVDSGVWGVPLPADAAIRDNTSWVTFAAPLDELTSFYRNYLTATGWLLDLENSETDPNLTLIGRCSSMVYALVSPVVWLNVLVWDDSSVSDGRVIQLLVTPDDDVATGNWLQLGLGSTD